MDSRFRAGDVERFTSTHGDEAGKTLALAAYTARLIGEEPELALHRAGSFSVKTRETDVFGEPEPVLYVSGDDEILASITEDGFARCDLAFLARVAERVEIPQGEALALLGRGARRRGSPAPSAYAFVHAILPGKYVSHALSDACLMIVNQPGAPEMIREIFGERALYVPYAPPGLALARRVIEQIRAQESEGRWPTLVVADRSGVFAWGETAHDSYERLIAAVTRAESYVAENRMPISRQTISAPNEELYVKLAPITRGLLEQASGRPWILAWRTSAAMRAFCDRVDMTLLTQFGCAAPEHAALMKPRPLVIGEIDAPDNAGVRKIISDAMFGFAASYEEYVRRAGAAVARRRATAKLISDPWPRLILFEGLGALATAADATDAEMNADIYEHTAMIMDAAHSMKGYQPATDADLFEAEHGAVAQSREARRDPRSRRPLERRIALVTGAVSAVGFAAARALLKAGAHVVLVDADAAELETNAKILEEDYPKRVAQFACDLGALGQLRRAVGYACVSFGGLDILVSHAPFAPAAAPTPLHAGEGASLLQTSFEPFLMAHQNAARAAVEALLLQGTGGALLFLTSGIDGGPSAVADAALMALMKRYAADLGARGVRANTLTYDRDRLDDAAQAIVFLVSATSMTACALSTCGGAEASRPTLPPE